MKKELDPEQGRGRELNRRAQRRSPGGASNISPLTPASDQRLEVQVALKLKESFSTVYESETRKLAEGGEENLRNKGN